MTEPPTAPAIPGISPEDLALFQAASSAIDEAYMARVTADCPQELVPGGVSFPLAEPHYKAKASRDLRPFADAIVRLGAERRGQLDGLLADKTIPDLQALMNDGRLSTVELVTYYVERIQRYDLDRLNSVLELNPHALAIAAERDAERAAGELRGPLHGIPLLLKDNIATGDGMHTTAGAYALQDWQPSRDAFLVQKLRAAGAVILGKTNLSEWANFMDACMPNGFSVLGGQTRSPYGPFEPAGSSSGSAVAAAANFAAAAIGSETSGSLIQPARFNSLVSLRPSLGLISRDYVVPLAPDLDTTGPMTRSVTDTAVLLNVLAGVDPQDAKTQDAAALEGVDFTQFLSLEAARKLRVGVIIPTQASAALLKNKTELLEKAKQRPLSKEEQEGLLAQEVLPDLGGDPNVALAALRALGIEVVEIDDATIPPGPDTAGPLLFCNFRRGAADFFGALPQPFAIRSLADVVAINDQDPANRAPYGQNLLAAAAKELMTAQEYARIHAVAAALAHQWMDTVLETNGVDVLVSGMAYTSSAGAAGVPALTIPAGLDPLGRPQGIILTGDYLSDPQLLSLGYALEQQIEGRVEPDLQAVIDQIDAVRTR